MFQRLEAKLDAILDKLERLSTLILNLQQIEAHAMAKIDDDLVALTAEVTKDTAVMSSAATLINGIQAQISAAVSAALAAGATDAQLASIVAVTTALGTAATPLAAAIAANTPAAPPAA